MIRFLDKSIGVLGGSFDPAHKGHLVISKIAIKKIKLSKVLWIVTKQNPFKKKTFYSLPQRITKARKLSKCALLYSKGRVIELYACCVLINVFCIYKQ